MSYQFDRWDDGVDRVEFSELQGKTMQSVVVTKNPVDDDEMVFTTTDGVVYVMKHDQDCCESVNLEDVTGDPNDLVGSPLVMAEETTKDGDETEYGDTSTWTFYRMRTLKGDVTLRWYGTSNGYYSETVDIYRILPKSE